MDQHGQIPYGKSDVRMPRPIFGQPVKNTTFARETPLLNTQNLTLVPKNKTAHIFQRQSHGLYLFLVADLTAINKFRCQHSLQKTIHLSSLHFTCCCAHHKIFGIYQSTSRRNGTTHLCGLAPIYLWHVHKFEATKIFVTTLSTLSFVFEVQFISQCFLHVGENPLEAKTGMHPAYEVQQNFNCSDVSWISVSKVNVLNLKDQNFNLSPTHQTSAVDFCRIIFWRECTVPSLQLFGRRELRLCGLEQD